MILKIAGFNPDNYEQGLMINTWKFSLVIDYWSFRKYSRYSRDNCRDNWRGSIAPNLRIVRDKNILMRLGVNRIN